MEQLLLKSEGFKVSHKKINGWKKQREELLKY